MWKVQYTNGNVIEYKTLLEATMAMQKNYAPGIVYDETGKAVILVTGFSFLLTEQADCQVNS